MKIRRDFVSNSSSASFVVNQDNGDLKLLCQKMAEIFHSVEIPYGIDDNIDIEIYTKNKWFKEVFEMLKPYEKCKYDCLYQDWHTKKMIKKDPEEICWDSIKISLEQFVNLIDFNIIDKIDHIYFSSANENDDICNYYLSKFFKFFEAIDCNPNASETERSFIDAENDEFFSIMTKMTNSKNEGMIQ